MLKLIKNEWIKVFSKISTYVLLALVLIFVVGFSVLMKISMNSSYGGYTYTDTDIEGEISYLDMSWISNGTNSCATTIRQETHRHGNTRR